MDYGQIIISALLLIFFVKQFIESKTKKNIFLIALFWWSLFYAGNYSLSDKLPAIPSLIIFILTLILYNFLYSEYKIIKSNK